MANLMQKVVSLCKRRGFIFPSSEIYGGFAGFWDFGPLGVLLKNNLKKVWWHDIVETNDNIYGLDSTIILNPKVWQASGHTGSGFADLLKECQVCHHRFRADDLKKDKCPDCGGKLTKEQKFNILVKTFIGPVEDKSTLSYLRGETCQGIFVNFSNVVNVVRPKIPFGIAQIGKAFRNEITPGNFNFRSREFEQMELEFFVRPGEDEKWFEKWKEARMKWHLSLGIKKKRLRFYEHPKEKLAHYSKRTVDVEYQFPFGWGELEGVANRTDFDLRNHSQHSGRDLSFVDEKGKKFYPYVIEPSVGAGRLALTLLVDAYREEKERVVLSLSPKISPYKVAVFPLLANKPSLTKLAQSVYQELKKEISIAWDERDNIGKRYYAQDEIGTPWCVTVDFDSLKKKDVTVRDRETRKQERVKITKLKDYFRKKLA
jgi:glycyl-tRNA synthetase